ncbi:MAG: membrane protein insertase YidC [Bacteroidetes bacterium]|nr:MAG: membrane protein insertase YidC [Bacteroidota bacterium]
MDRNVVIATVLIALIMVVWFTWMSPSTVPEQVTGPVVADSTERFEIEAPVFQAPEPIVPGQVPVFTAGDSTVLGSQDGVVRDIVVESDFYTAVFSTRGGTITSMSLKTYTKFGSDEAVQLIDTTKGGAIGIVFMSPNNRIYDTRSFTFESSAPNQITLGDVPVELVFRSEVGAGAIVKRYTLNRESYEIGISVSFEAPETFLAQGDYEIVWNGGLPFTEGDHQLETTKSGAYASSGGDVESVTLMSDSFEERSLRGVVEWIAVKNKYFMAALIPAVEARGAELIAERFGELDDEDVRLDFVASLEIPITDSEADEFKLYLGPMEFKRINAYGVGLYDTVDFGWDFFEALTRPLAKFIFIPTFAFLSSFIPNYGLIIIIFSILIKLLLFPLTKKSFRSMAKMRELQPRMEAIKEKYRDNPQKQQKATMKMYKETGVNPLGGCMPMLLQYPIIIALWMFLPQAIEIRQQGFLWATDLSAPDVILSLPFTIPMYGNYVGGFTLLMGLSMVVQMKIQAMPGSGAQQKMFMYLMPLMMFVIFNKFAAGLSLYYLCYNVLTAAQQKLINSQLRKENEAKEASGTSDRARKDPPKKKRKSLTTNGRAKARSAKKSRR